MFSFIYLFPKQVFAPINPFFYLRNSPILNYPDMFQINTSHFKASHEALKYKHKTY